MAYPTAVNSQVTDAVTQTSAGKKKKPAKAKRARKAKKKK